MAPQELYNIVRKLETEIRKIFWRKGWSSNSLYFIQILIFNILLSAVRFLLPQHRVNKCAVIFSYLKFTFVCVICVWEIFQKGKKLRLIIALVLSRSLLSIFKIHLYCFMLHTNTVGTIIWVNGDGYSKHMSGPSLYHRHHLDWWKLHIWILIYSTNNCKQFD